MKEGLVKDIRQHVHHYQQRQEGRTEIGLSPTYTSMPIKEGRKGRLVRTLANIYISAKHSTAFPHFVVRFFSRVPSRSSSAQHKLHCWMKESKPSNVFHPWSGPTAHHRSVRSTALLWHRNEINQSINPSNYVLHHGRADGPHHHALQVGLGEVAHGRHVVLVQQHACWRCCFRV